MIRNTDAPFFARAFGKAAQTSPRPPVEANGTISALTKKTVTMSIVTKKHYEHRQPNY